MVESEPEIEVLEPKPEPMHLYKFASVRGDDFEVEGPSPEEAWKNLCVNRDARRGLWRFFDETRNKVAVVSEGFIILYPDEYSPVYKQVI